MNKPFLLRIGLGVLAGGAVALGLAAAAGALPGHPAGRTAAAQAPVEPERGAARAPSRAGREPTREDERNSGHEAREHEREQDDDD